MRVIVSNALSGLSYGRLLASIASVSILALGIIAVLNQIGIALTVTLPVLIAVLGTIGGILVVGVGGGLIRPMQQRWEDYLSRIEVEGRNVRERRSGRPPEGTADYQDAGPTQPLSSARAASGAHSQPSEQAAPLTNPYPQQSRPQGRPLS